MDLGKSFQTGSRILTVTMVILALLFIHSDGCCRRQLIKARWPSLKDADNRVAQWIIACERPDVKIEVIAAAKESTIDVSDNLKQLVVKIYVNNDGKVMYVPTVEAIVMDPVVGPSDVIYDGEVNESRMKDDEIGDQENEDNEAEQEDI